MGTTQTRRLAALLVGVPILGTVLTGTSAALSEPPTTDHPGCTPYATANVCENLMSRRQASDSAWKSAELRFKERHHDVRQLDVGDPGASPGDTTFFDNELLDESGSTTVGRFLSRCLQLTDAMYQCQGSLLFPNGTIELSTTTFLGEEIVAAVTGGTGQHAGANGQARITPTGTAGISAILVDLAK